MTSCSFVSPASLNPPKWLILQSNNKSFSSVISSASNTKGLFRGIQASSSSIAGRVLVQPVTATLKTSEVGVSGEAYATRKSLRNINEAESGKLTFKDVEKTGPDVLPLPLVKETKTKRISSVAAHSTKLDYNQIIRYPVLTETAVKAILEHNTLVFVVDKYANKKDIREAVKKMLQVVIKKVNTLMTPDGTKKAYVMLAKGCNGLDVAKKMKLL